MPLQPNIFHLDALALTGLQAATNVEQLQFVPPAGEGIGGQVTDGWIHRFPVNGTATHRVHFLLICQCPDEQVVDGLADRGCQWPVSQILLLRHFQPGNDPGASINRRPPKAGS